MKRHTLLLSYDEAYDAMYDFLDHYYEITHSDDIGALLGDLALLPDGMPADASILKRWNKILNSINPKSPALDTVAAYYLVYYFFKVYQEKVASSQVRWLTNNMMLTSHEQRINIEYWFGWSDSVHRIVKQDPPFRPRLHFTVPIDKENAADTHGNQWCVKMTPDGKQIWAQVRNNIIHNGGINEIPRSFDPSPILLRKSRSSSLNAMSLQGRVDD